MRWVKPCSLKRKERHVNDFEPVEVFRGHFGECVKHLAERMAVFGKKGEHGIQVARKPIAEFCNVRPSTVTRWFYEKSGPPLGETYIKMLCYLSMIGYTVIELEHMPQGRRGMLELIGFGLLSAKEASTIIGYINHQDLYRVLFGACGTSPDKDQKMWEIWKLRKEELQERRVEMAKQYIIHFPRQEQPVKLAIAEETIPPESEAAPSAASKPPPPRKPVIVLMEGLHSLLQANPLDKLSQEELGEFAEKSEVVYSLSIQLHLLATRLAMLQQKEVATRCQVTSVTTQS